MVNAVVIAQSSNGLLNTLLAIENRLRRTRDTDSIRRMQSQLEESRKVHWDQATPVVRARYRLLHGALLAKAARNNPSDWIGSSSEKLQDALVEFQQCLEIISSEAFSSGQVTELRQMMQACTYESHVVSSVLRVWGEDPNIIFGTDALSSEQKRKEQNARRHRHMLKSLF